MFPRSTPQSLRWGFRCAQRVYGDGITEKTGFSTALGYTKEATMDTATMSTRKLAIDGMSGDACVKNVTGALKSVQGVSTSSVEVGSATIHANKAGCDAACAAIGTAGYKAREGSATDPVGGTEHAPAKHDMKSDAKPEMKPEMKSDVKHEHKGDSKLQMPGAVASAPANSGAKHATDVKSAPAPVKAAH